MKFLLHTELTKENIMREIKFLGKIENNDGWYGSNCTEGTMLNGKIVDKFIPKTVRQFIGRQDIQGNDVYEGDIIQSTSLVGFVRWDNMDGSFKVIAFNAIYFFDDLNEPKVIGNIFDNPDILMEKF